MNNNTDDDHKTTTCVLHNDKNKVKKNPKTAKSKRTYHTWSFCMFSNILEHECTTYTATQLYWTIWYKNTSTKTSKCHLRERRRFWVFVLTYSSWSPPVGRKWAELIRSWWTLCSCLPDTIFFLSQLKLGCKLMKCRFFIFLKKKQLQAEKSCKQMSLHELLGRPIYMLMQVSSCFLFFFVNCIWIRWLFTLIYITWYL